MPRKSAIAIGAHPDDIEFYMAGTLVLLRQAGWETHYLSVANGNCGSTRYGRAELARLRAKEGKDAARILGAKYHASITNDLEIFYNLPLLQAVAAVIRDVKPSIVLTHSPQDYMEDHTNTSRLAVTAAFARGMPNFPTRPQRKAADYDVTVYHAMPHGLCDQLRRRITPGSFVNTTGVNQIKCDALQAHKSQYLWLETSQGMESLHETMENMSRTVGKMSKRFPLAEGWRRHLHLGFAPTDADPLADALGRNHLVNTKYERDLGKGE